MDNTEKKICSIVTHRNCRLVKSEDLNHHGTLFAGRVAQWFVEAGFIAAANLTNSESIVCLNVHGMLFMRPINNGVVVRLESKIVFAGKTRLVAYVKVVDNRNDNFFVDGFITFINVQKDGKRKPHGISIQAINAEDKILNEKAKLLQKNMPPGPQYLANDNESKNTNKKSCGRLNAVK